MPNVPDRVGIFDPIRRAVGWLSAARCGAFRGASGPDGGWLWVFVLSVWLGQGGSPLGAAEASALKVTAPPQTGTQSLSTANLSAGQNPPTSALSLPAEPTQADLQRLRLFPEPLLPVGRAPSPEENGRLAAALRQHAQRTQADDFSWLEQFVAADPGSPWVPSLLLDLGLEYYKSGWYSKALSAWERSWAGLKSSGDPAARALADRAVGELSLMYARLGRMKALSELLDSLQGRTLIGPGRDKVNRGRQALWTMQHHPEIAFRCGPLALDRILQFKHQGNRGLINLQESGSTTNGLSLTQVAQLSRKVGLNYQMAFRAKGAPLLMPAVVNWKVGHYAALLREKGGLYLLQDATFHNDAWMSARALDEETSGYFLVPAGKLPPGWRPVSPAEGQTVWGKGVTGSSDPNNNTPNDQQSCGGGGAAGMAVCSVYLLDVSLNVRDQPVGYTPPVGPPVKLVVNYNQLESDQPAQFNYSNLGAQWTFSFLAYITDDPATPDADVNYFTVAGGTLPFSGFDSTSQTFAPQIKSQALLSRTSSSSYRMLFADGSSYIFDLPDSTDPSSRRVFLTQMIDPQGNALKVSYDNQFRVVSVTDALGQVTAFSYGDPADRLKLTKVTDPFGRFASFTYDTSNRLAQITDCLGLTSQFTYDSGDNIVAMTTPYGKTSFAFGQSGRTTWLETTYPDGEKERAEYTEATSVGTDSQDPASTLPLGMFTRDWVMYARNTYFWDKNAYWAYAANTNDYSSAFIYHWLHDQSLGTAMGVLESVKPALENRIWFNYTGQSSDNSGATVIGTSDRPTVIGRVLDDGTTQLRKFSYNDLGLVTNSVDPLGRSLTCVYASNLVDLLELRQTTGGNNDLLAQVQYNSAHRPIAIVDAAGQKTVNTYNARGQILTTTDPKGEKTSFTYDANGYLISIAGPLQTANDTTNFTYDSVGRIRTLTDAEGYTLTYSYDNLDRLTNISYPDGTFEAFTYDKLDRVLAQDRLGHQTHYTYDALRRLVATQDPLGRLTRFQYCGCGSLSGLTDPLGQQTTWTHDIEGRVTGKVYADGSRVTYQYEKTTGRIQSIVDEQGQYRVYGYYPDDSLKSVSYPVAKVPTPAVTFTYDPNYRRVLTMQDGIGTTAYSYNPVTLPPAPGAAQLAAIDGPLPGSQITFQYDALGRVASRAINGVSQAITFDALSRPMVVTNALGKFQYSYAGATPRLALEIYPNGQSNSYAYYDNLGDQRLEQVQHFKPGGGVLSALGYAYNAVGQITGWTNQWDTLPTGLWVPSYDAAYQVTGVLSSGGPGTVTNYSYAYDAAGNRLRASMNGVENDYAYNILNQLVSGGPAPGDAAYQWDAENRLAAINEGNKTSAFSYDGLGRRSAILEQANGLVTSSNQFLWCDGEICEERDAGGSVVKRFFPQGEISLGPTGSTNYFYTRDHLGSVREVLNASGALVARYTYGPYGEKSIVQESYPSTFGFGGYFAHGPSGLDLSWFRPLDSAVGRWLSRDPISGPALILKNSFRFDFSGTYLPARVLPVGPNQTLPEASGLNLYEFALDDPINFTDPLGLWTFTVGVSVSGWFGLGTGNDSLGVAVDGHGNFGWFDAGGGGAGVGAGISGGISFTGSNAETICDLGGWFSNISVGAGEGLGGSIEGFAGPSDHGTVVGGGFTVGPGLGGGFSGGGSYTVVQPVGRLW